MCVWCVSVPSSVYGRIISHVVYCRAAQTDVLLCISFQAARCVCSRYNNNARAQKLCHSPQWSGNLLVTSVSTL